MEKYSSFFILIMLIYPKNYQIVLAASDQDPDRYETIMIESEIRKGVFHKVVKDLESGKAVSCSCGCWSKGNKPCAGMRSVGYEIL
jgi:hypothetical protein